MVDRIRSRSLGARALCLVGLVVGTTTVSAPVSTVLAAGTPDISLIKSVDETTLYGDDIEVTLTASNPTGDDGYNLSFNDTLPAGVSFSSGTPAPTAVLPQVDGTTVLVWQNVADLLSGASFDLSYSVAVDAGIYDVDDTITNSANAYVNSDPRLVPDFDPTTGAATGDFTGNDASGPVTTTLVAFELTKSEPSAEDELLRGIHDHQTRYTLTIENNGVNPTSGFSIVDFLPAGLEFLGCGTVDNTTTGDEYPGSGSINPGNAPTLVNPCPTPSSVTTVDLDPDGTGPLPQGVYTRVEWDSSALPTSALIAGGSFSLDYVAAIPLFENTSTGFADPGDDPTANLDNNTGPLTSDEQQLTNYAIASGFYDGRTAASTDADIETVVAEDVSIHKTIDSGSFDQASNPRFTLDIETSEYVTATGDVVVTDVLPAALDFTSATPSPDGPGTLNGDGTLTLTWTLSPPLDPANTADIEILTDVRAFYRLGDDTDGAPVAADDSFENTTALTTEATLIIDRDANTAPATVVDASEAGAAAGGSTILKEVSEPPAGTLTCDDGSGITFDADEAGDYTPGDIVCWRLNVFFPGELDTIDPVVTDFLPAGYEFVSWAYGVNTDVFLGDDSTDFSETPTLTWDLSNPDVDASGDADGVEFEVVIQSRIVDPNAAASGDITSNLMKYSYRNSDGDVFQRRDQADATWTEPELDLTKAVVSVDGSAVAPPSDGVAVEGGDAVTFQVSVVNGGTSDALAASVRDVLPAEIRCGDVSSISNGGECVAATANDYIQWDTDDGIDVAAGATVNLTYEVAVPTGISAGETYVNTAGVREYTADTNDPDNPTFTYVPADNIDPTLTPNTSAADDTSSIVTPAPTVTKTRSTDTTETGNSNGQATIGETVSYAVDVDLTPGVAYYEAAITDTLPDGFDLQAGTVSATLDGVLLPTNGLTLLVDDADNSWQIVFPTTYTVPGGTAQEIIVSFDAVVLDVADNFAGENPRNLAELTYDNDAGTTRTESGGVRTRIVEPFIALAKADDDADDVVEAGQVITYTVTLSNSGADYTSTAYDTVVVDTVPPELAVDETSISNSGVYAAGATASDPATITWTIASLAPDDSIDLTYEAQTINPIIAGTMITNEVTADTTSRESATVGDAGERSTGGRYTADADATVIVPTPATAKSGTPDAATVGETVTFTLTATLPGGAITYDTTLLDDLPDGLTFDSLMSITCVEDGGTCDPDIGTADADVLTVTPAASGDDVAFFFGDLTNPADDDRVLTIVYDAYVADVAASNGGATLTNSAALSWNETDQVTDPTEPGDLGTFDASSTPGADDVDTIEPDITIDKDVSGQVGDTDTRRAKPGDVLTYTLTITNEGTGPAHDLTVTDVASDDGWAFTDTTADTDITNTDSDPDGGLAWSIPGPIAAGDTATITYTLTVPVDFDSSDELAGAEQVNVADVPSYSGVSAADRAAEPDRSYREYTDVSNDTVSIEVDLASIGDLVWYDIDRDGVRDPGEPGLTGVDVTVTYLGPDGELGGGDDETVTVPTDSTGNYLVENLPGGDFIVAVDTGDLPTGMSATYDLDDGTTGPDDTWVGALGEAEDKSDVDFGYSGDGSIGDTIWFDQDGDGIQDAGEAGIAGVGVTVSWAGPDEVPGNGDDVAYTTSTDASGNYLVDDLPAGDFTVVVDSGDLPAGYSVVSDPDSTVDGESTVTLAAGEDDLDRDFGYNGSGSIGDTIFLDENGDGDQDPGEPGVAGVPLTLVSFGPDGIEGGDDDSTFTTTTGAGGSYLFENLPPGEYEITVGGALPASLANTTDPDGGNDNMSRVSLALGENDLDRDFGYDAESVLGDFVWLDFDSDGVQDAGEPGLQGVEVTAVWYGLDGAPGGGDDITYMTTTDADGLYLFDDIPDGDYSVTITNGLPAGLDATFDDDGSLDGTSVTTLVDSDLDQDFGYAGDFSIGDLVWLDRDGDGDVDAGEPGLENIDIELTWFGPDGVEGGGDDISVTTQTDVGGNYLFPGLPPGEYSVVVVDSDPDFPVGVQPTYDLDDGTTAPDGATLVTVVDDDVDVVDFGYRGVGSIGDTIWFDRNRDGTFDGDEVGLGGVDLALTYFGEDGVAGGGDDEVFTTTTEADGSYIFLGLPAGEYLVDVDESDLPTGMTPTFDPNGGDDGLSRVSLASGENDLAQDFGYAGDATIGDTIFIDLDGDGAQDPLDPGVPGQTVELTWAGPTGPETFVTTTDATGNYEFDGLPDGDYTVTVVGGIVDAAVNTGDPDGGGDSTSVVDIDGQVDDLDRDFGYRGENSIGDTVWFDTDADGVDDVGEPRLGGVIIAVAWFGPDGAEGGGDDIAFPVATTGIDGQYLAESLPDGSFSVTVTGGLPAGVAANTFDGDDGTTDPDGRSIVTDLGVGVAGPGADFDQDFGYTGSGSIGDTVWLDLDGDGTLDDDEPGIPNATVTLTWAGLDGTFGTADDVVYDPSTTVADGAYSFVNLPAGEFRVDITGLPDGVDPSGDPDGGADNSSVVTLGAGESDLNQDFGYVGDASVGDTVFIDVDADGVQDPGEPGLAGVTVTVVSPGVDGVPGTADDLVVTIVTDADGRYLADGLPSGNTSVSYDAAELDEGYVPDSDLDGGEPTLATVDLARGDARRDVDFGIVGDAQISGTVWIDTDADGVRDSTESGIPGVTVIVTWDGPDGPVALTAMTDDDGNWSIDEVPPGGYTVTVDRSTLPDGLVPTTPDEVGVTVPPGGSGSAANGFVPAASIGDLVWSDLDRDGVVDSGETGISGVTVTLFDGSGSVIATTTTDTDGTYLFEGLTPATYTVTLDLATAPDGLTVVFDPDGVDDGATSVTVAAGENVRTADFGLRAQVIPRTGASSIGDVIRLGATLLTAGLALLVLRRRRPQIVR